MNSLTVSVAYEPPLPETLLPEGLDSEVMAAWGLPRYEAQAEVSHVLRYRQGRLELAACQSRQAPTCVDFSDAALQYRRQTSGRRQGIARAVGLHLRPAQSVLDATAGLGRDAFILAALGCQVTLLERTPWVHALLADGLRRGLAQQENPLLHEVLARMQLFQADARGWCQQIIAGEQPQPDVIYLDPMFPARRKSALVKKDMASLQRLLGPDPDIEDLLVLSRQAAGRRVVLKRPGGKGDSGLPACDLQITGKSSHFDVYLKATAPDLPSVVE